MKTIVCSLLLCFVAILVPSPKPSFAHYGLKAQPAAVEIVDFRQLLINHTLKYVDPGMTIDSIDLNQVDAVLTDFQYGPYTVSDVQPQLLNEWRFNNDGTTQITQHFSQSVSKALVETWAVTRGIKQAYSTSFKINEIVSGGASTELTFSETDAKQETKTITDTNTTDIPIAPKTKTKITVSLYQYTIAVPWTATIRLRGSYHFIGHSDPDPHTHKDYDGRGPLGKVFRFINHPAFTILDDQTIVFNAEGTYRGVHSQRWSWEIKSTRIGIDFAPDVTISTSDVVPPIDRHTKDYPFTILREVTTKKP